ncbi:MAG: hypothetical protein PHV55_08255 [Candidatus Omnitrophica bacterium]|nr:hypothetical protein [Candidatus Omnitrophota bacterium]
MFDLSKLGDMSKLAAQAKEIQQNQDRATREQTELLRTILKRLEEIIVLLKKDA